ncbi:MAG: hypothetical protein HY931_03760 [Candidatus Falkowbacteria bacterium]|nr:MAG: hypothetical protein HY931_03760 [Candidatus Falkowbacteria bacterium]
MEQQEKIALIGETSVPGRISQEKFDNLVKNRITQKFTWKHAVAYCFCRHCGTYGESSKGYLEGLLKTAEELKQPLVIVPETFSSYYFVVDACIICCNKKNLEKIEAFKIEA